ncbi:MAG: substrate-binding domain-containing protein [Henriciella sp.]|nr:substrate-binding domain-containing protein [Henriciella sp.]
MRIAVSLIASLALAACGDPVKLSEIPEQVDAPPVFSIGEAEKIRIVGSSTVAPFSTTAAEQFGAISPHPAPIVETTGTGGGFKAFCRAIGPAEPSIVNASRQMKDSERAQCAEAGIIDPVRIKIGYDGIVLANRKAGPVLNLTKSQIFRALAANLPDQNGGWTANPYRLWSDVDPALPEIRILVSGPPPTSGTRDAFVEIAMEGGARTFEILAALEQSDPDSFRARAHEIRNDGAWIDSGENDSTIINTLLRNDDSIGVLGYSFLEQNLDRIKAATVGDTQPTFENIISGEYEVSRSMYFYVKREHLPLVPGLAEFVEEFTQEDAWGPDGYLADKGLIPLLPEERASVRETVLAALTDPKNPPPSENVPSPPQSDAVPPG